MLFAPTHIGVAEAVTPPTVASKVAVRLVSAPCVVPEAEKSPTSNVSVRRNVAFVARKVTVQYPSGPVWILVFGLRKSCAAEPVVLKPTFGSNETNSSGAEVVMDEVVFPEKVTSTAPTIAAAPTATIRNQPLITDLLA